MTTLYIGQYMPGDAEQNHYEINVKSCNDFLNSFAEKLKIILLTKWMSRFVI